MSKPSVNVETNRRLTAYALGVLGLAICVNVQDGFDILSISFAAADLTRSLDLQPTELGSIFSASLFGMMIGALLFGPVADRFGRRICAIVALATSGFGMILAAASPDASLLVLGRALTGLGIGGVLVSMNTLVAESAGVKYRSMAVALFQMGYPLGGIMAGYVALILLDMGGWRYVFYFGALLSFVFIPIVMMMPESLSFLARAKGEKAARRFERTRTRLGYHDVTREHFLAEGQDGHGSTLEAMRTLFSKTYRLRTALIWTAFFCTLITLYFLFSWVPKLVIDVGLSDEDGNRAGRVLNFVGMIGIVAIGVIGLFIRSSLATCAYLVALTVVMVAVPLVGFNASTLFILVAAFGFFMHGTMIGLYTIVAGLYPPQLRATGTGWAIGLSRFGAVIGPVATGFFIEAQWPVEDIIAVFAIPVFLAALCVAGLITIRAET